jgi:hypothetical protein
MRGLGISRMEEGSLGQYQLTADLIMWATRQLKYELDVL